MEEERYEELEKHVNYLNEEGFTPEGTELRVYRNADELITAIRNNQVPGISWTQDDEAKWLATEAIDNAFKEVKDNKLPMEEDLEEPDWEAAEIDMEEFGRITRYLNEEN